MNSKQGIKHQFHYHIFCIKSEHNTLFSHFHAEYTVLLTIVFRLKLLETETLDTCFTYTVAPARGGKGG